MVDGKPVIYLFGKTVDNTQICVLDDSLTPYFYVIPRNGLDWRTTRIQEHTLHL